MPRLQADSRALLNDPGLELTYNGRGALLRACLEISHRRKRHILMPAYHCPSGITPAIHAGLHPVFYRIRRDLSIDYEDLYAKVDHNTAAILIIHYFGIASDIRPLQALRHDGIDVIEDWSHSFLQGSPPKLSGGDSDYRIYSFWKLVPSAVGGGLWRQRVAKDACRVPMNPPPLRERVGRLKRLLEVALYHSDYQRAKWVFTQIESFRLGLRRARVDAESTPGVDILPGESHYPFDEVLANCRMPGLARRMLESSSFSEISHQRRDNFNHYGQFLNDLQGMTVLYRVLPKATCPWVFPVLLNHRDEIDYRWRDMGVALYTFGLYLHSALLQATDASTIADAHYLSKNLLCLAVHQDLNVNHIDRSVVAINRYFGRHSRIDFPAP